MKNYANRIWSKNERRKTLCLFAFTYMLGVCLFREPRVFCDLPWGVVFVRCVLFLLFLYLFFVWKYLFLSFLFILFFAHVYVEINWCFVFYSLHSPKIPFLISFVFLFLLFPQYLSFPSVSLISLSLFFFLLSFFFFPMMRTQGFYKYSKKRNGKQKEMTLLNTVFEEVSPLLLFSLLPVWLNYQSYLNCHYFLDNFYISFVIVINSISIRIFIIIIISPSPLLVLSSWSLLLPS